MIRIIRQAAHDLNDAVDIPGEPAELVAVIQYLEQAAHTAGRYWGTVPLPDPSSYDGMSLEALRAAIEKRNEDRNEDDRIPVSGTKADLRDRLVDDDALMGAQLP